MPWYLKVVDGDSQDLRVQLKPSHTVTIGRTNATATFQEDDSMSSVHFAVNLVGGVVRLQNLSQANGTEVNGQLAEAAVLQAGDQIKAGRTTFIVHPPAPSPYPAPHRIGGWGFESIPEGWQAIEGVGLHFVVNNEERFRATITAVEEPLPAAQTLLSYIETQINLAQGRIAGISVVGPVPVAMRGSDEASSLSITVAVLDKPQVIQRQVYALSSGIVGIFTATVLESEPHRDTIDTLIAGLSYFHG
jgi:hypothetical protein